MRAAAGADAAPQDVLLYDGACGFCEASVQFVLRHDRAKLLKFAPLKGALASAVTARHPELAHIDSIVWVERLGGRDEQVHVRSAAMLEVAAYLGGMWRVASFARVIPAKLRDAIYALVARHRHRLIGGRSGCLVLSAEEQARFLS